jgi:nodulation protein E
VCFGIWPFGGGILVGSARRRCGLGKLDEQAPSDLKVSIVGAVPAPDPRHMLDARKLPMLDRFSVLAIVAAQQALARSSLSFENGGHRAGYVVGLAVSWSW